MVRLGVIGLGTAWEERYRPALKRQQRARVTAVFDAVATRAEHVADELRVPAVKGMLALARRTDVDAVLLLDAGWYGAEAVRLLCAASKAVYLAADIGRDSATLQALHWTAVSYGLTLMPELQLRYTPASARLRELMATKLGRPKQIRVQLGETTSDNGEPDRNSADVCRLFVNWFDWLRYVARSVPRTIGVEPEGDRSEGMRIAVEFGRERAEETVIADLVIGGDSTEEIGRPEITCEHGSAVITSPTTLRWETEDGSVEETLTADRDETEVMLDHFCRRVVGGLIPVPDLSDVSRSLELYDAMWTGYDTGAAVSLNGQS